MLTSLWLRIESAARRLADDERGVTTEHVIWIAALAALALTITALFGPKILAAAQAVSFQ
ncbi:hypothetical protein [Streptantibioticus silvisoli]|uniref:Flp family type IVb pilin n=1 Tax=Streptantibioticus silvisoli TaxID=2705255 RepID=A0ABT6VZZ9_9ACTN|nr:hypothetical protein [Streptantibioticus silvisoli]MDI5964073.1 hypothetical protein [Streptantibioticus silvisoli]